MCFNFFPIRVKGDALISACILLTIWKHGVNISGSSDPKQSLSVALLSTPWVIVPNVTPCIVHFLCVAAITTYIPPSSLLYGVLPSSLRGTSIAPCIPPFISVSSKLRNPPVALPSLNERPLLFDLYEATLVVQTYNLHLLVV